MSGIQPTAVLNLCEQYLRLADDARHWLRYLDRYPTEGRTIARDALDAYQKLDARDQLELTLYVEIAASYNVWHAPEWMSVLHEHNTEHPNVDRRASWEVA